MSVNRLFKVLIALTLIMVVFFTVRKANTTAALSNTDRSYDAVEQVRAVRPESNLLADRSYDAIESFRSQKAVERVIADRSYDLIEGLRATRAMP